MVMVVGGEIAGVCIGTVVACRWGIGGEVE